MKTVATEIRIYADDAGKYQVPAGLKGDVAYGRGIKSLAAFLYSEGVVANDRICTFLNSLSGDSLDISEGSIYHFCKEFSSRLPFWDRPRGVQCPRGTLSVQKHGGNVKQMEP